jgi:hypothetical protein
MLVTTHLSVPSTPHPESDPHGVARVPRNAVCGSGLPPPWRTFLFFDQSPVFPAWIPPSGTHGDKQWRDTPNDLLLASVTAPCYTENVDVASGKAMGHHAPFQRERRDTSSGRVVLVGCLMN